MATVVNNINYFTEQTYKSNQDMLTTYFTRPTTVLPQSYNTLYKFAINDKVYIDATPQQRRHIGFKYTLNKGT